VATTTDDSQEEPGEKKAERKSWAAQWSDADKRLFLITLLGGLAANVGLVIIVALGFLSARGIAWYVRHGNDIASTYYIYVVVGILTGIVWLPLRFKSFRRYRVVSLVIGSLPTGILLLGLLGYLAGIR